MKKSKRDRRRIKAGPYHATRVKLERRGILALVPKTAREARRLGRMTTKM